MANIKRANNSSVTKTSTTPIPDVPDAPSISAINSGFGRAYNDGAATLTLTAAATGGGTITSYTALSTPGSFTATGTSPLTVTGLQSATSYTFQVKGTNASGTGSYGGASSSITATTKPQAPTVGTATKPTSSTASVTFTANATGGSAITGYTVLSSSGATNTGASSPIVVTETVSGTYTYTVTATNPNGTSVASSASNSLTFTGL